jgi:hypothetical protein
LDAERTMLYFAPRKPRSGWSKPNKERVARLLGGGLMAPAGLAKVEAAKADGSWSALDSVEALEVPADLAAALARYEGAAANFEAFRGRRSGAFWSGSRTRSGVRRGRSGWTRRPDSRPTTSGQTSGSRNDSAGTRARPRAHPHLRRARRRPAARAGGVPGVLPRAVRARRAIHHG